MKTGAARVLERLARRPDAYESAWCSYYAISRSAAPTNGCCSNDDAAAAAQQRRRAWCSSSSSVTGAAEDNGSSSKVAQPHEQQQHQWQRWRILAAASPSLPAAAAAAARAGRAQPLLTPRRGISSSTCTAATSSSTSASSTSSAASRPPPLDLATTDAIHLRGLEFFGRHGVLPEETALGQKFVVDATLYMGARGLAAAGASDDVGDSVDYAGVYARIREVMEGGPPFKLVEAAAAALCRRILEDHPKAAAVRVAVYKPHVALRGPLQTVGVELFRARGGGGGGA